MLRETADHCKHELFRFLTGRRRFLPTYQSGEGDLGIQNLSTLNNENFALNLGAAVRDPGRRVGVDNIGASELPSRWMLKC